MDARLPIVVIDGPAGVGKTTVARLLAQKLDIPYLDTGAMFRFVATRLGPDGPNLPDEKLARACGALVFRLSGTGAASVLSCDGLPAGPDLRAEATGSLASLYATRPPVRAAILKAEREIGAHNSLVADGRDLGTVVFPAAEYKFFLDAAPEIRARRRWLELKEKGYAGNVADLERDIRKRDLQDRTRAVAPLRPAGDAIIIDTSHLDIQQTLAALLKRIQAGGGFGTSGT